MASKSTETSSAAKAEKQESVYTVEEFANAARKTFGVSPDIVSAAFVVNGLTEATLSEARKIVTTFAKKEVN